MMSDKYTEEAVKQWRDRVYGDADYIDPTNQHDWRSLCYGFMLGLGNDHDEAEDYVKECDNRGLL